MPHINVLKKSNFLKKEDCGPGILVTITGCTELNVAADGAPEELKWCLHFSETEKPLVLNSTNGQIIAGFTGSDNTDDWKDRKIVLYHDPTVSFGGKLIGGIRARAPRNLQAGPMAKPGPPVQHPPAAQPLPNQPPPVAGQPGTPWPTEAAKAAAAEDDVPF